MSVSVVSSMYLWEVRDSFSLSMIILSNSYRVVFLATWWFWRTQTCVGLRWILMSKQWTQITVDDMWVTWIILIILVTITFYGKWFCTMTKILSRQFIFILFIFVYLLYILVHLLSCNFYLFITVPWLWVCANIIITATAADSRINDISPFVWRQFVL